MECTTEHATVCGTMLSDTVPQGHPPPPSVPPPPCNQLYHSLVLVREEKEKRKKFCRSIARILSVRTIELHSFSFFFFFFFSPILHPVCVVPICLSVSHE
ncbi:hypothetical protein L873DRAFT_335857 [Choiromyces venosus 120613-1]|uniref:Uncharacterized protein n=1 Tax=Choiromyces venosus 120613-1 TaxID=1336337 RepID=A0A3N4J471_9PEZI|nr:hypothetical protein L873DRAFT_335857 [Choiromyces venosus 120613-1]